MISQRERTISIQTLRQFPGHLAQLVADMSDEQLDFARFPGDWSTRQVIHHLADSHINAYIRSKFVVTQEQPPLRAYAQEIWAELPDAKTLPLAPSIAILSGLHERWALFFENLSESDFARVGVHSEDGPTTLDAMLEHYAWHCDNHLAQIQTLRDAQSI